MMQDNPDPDYMWEATVSGSSIPDWFIHQNVGSYVIVELPLHYYNTNLLGLAVCASFVKGPGMGFPFDLCNGRLKCWPCHNLQGREDDSEGSDNEDYSEGSDNEDYW